MVVQKSSICLIRLMFLLSFLLVKKLILKQFVYLLNRSILLTMIYTNAVLLRRLKQNKDELFSQFVTRVCQRAKNCNLVTETLISDNYILEKIVDGCYSDEIRKELMRKGLQSLKDAEDQANVIETINA